MVLIAWSRAYRLPTAAGSHTQRSRFMLTTPPSHITDNSRWILLSHCLPVPPNVLICVSPATFTAFLLSKTKNAWRRTGSLLERARYSPGVSNGVSYVSDRPRPPGRLLAQIRQDSQHTAMVSLRGSQPQLCKN